MDQKITTKQSKIETSSDQEMNISNISLYDLGVKLHEKIKNYPGGGIKGVWEAIDPGLKDIEPSPKKDIKYPKNIKKIKKDAFRRAVNRLADKNRYKDNRMSFGIGGNLIILLNVFEILGIKCLSDLMDVSFNKPIINEYIIDTNIVSKKIKKRLKKISYDLQESTERKPRFSIPVFCNDWLNILYEFNELIFPNEANQNDLESSTNIFNKDVLLGIYVNKLETDDSKFAVGFNNILSRYKGYIFNYKLLNEYYKNIVSLDTSKYYSVNNYFILSPLYAIYFLILMNKRFFNNLSIDKKGKRKDDKNKINFSFISIKNISKNIFKILDVETADEKEINEKTIGQYILKRFIYIENNLSKVLKLGSKPYSKISKDDFTKYLKIFKNVFNVLFDMNLHNTDINQDWVDNTISKVKNLNELYNEMVLGRANIFFPTDEHIILLNDSLQTIEKIADSLERDNE